MNISNGHNGAQGHALPEKHNSGAFAYGLSEDGFGTLDAGCAPGIAALMEYLRADLTDIAHSCELIEGGTQ